MEACAEVQKAPGGTPNQLLFLRSEPIQTMERPSRSPDEAVLAPIVDPASPAGKLDASIAVPKVLHAADPEYSESAWRKGVQGICLFQLSVDEYGLPRDIKELKAVDPSLQQSAYAALWQYRFKPAMKEGIPVKVRIGIEVNFRF